MGRLEGLKMMEDVVKQMIKQSERNF